MPPRQQWDIRKDIYKATGDGAPPPPPPSGNIPAWIQVGTEVHSRGRGQPYETGDRDLDGFSRQRHTGNGAPEGDPFPQAYSDPRAFQRILVGFYNAGRTGDRGPEQILNGPYAQTPFGRLLVRAYGEGQQSRGPQGPRGPQTRGPQPQGPQQQPRYGAR